MKKAILGIPLLLVLLLAPFVGAEKANVKVLITEEPHYLHVVVNDTSLYTELTKNTSLCNVTVNALYKSLFLSKSEVKFKACDLKTQGVVDYVFEPTGQIQGNGFLIMPQIQLKKPLPISIVKKGVEKCNQGYCEYTLVEPNKTILTGNTIPVLKYKISKYLSPSQIVLVTITDTGKLVIGEVGNRVHIDTKGCTIQHKDNSTVMTCPIRKFTVDNGTVISWAFDKNAYTYKITGHKITFYKVGNPKHPNLFRGSTDNVTVVEFKDVTLDGTLKNPLVIGLMVVIALLIFVNIYRRY